MALHDDKENTQYIEQQDIGIKAYPCDVQSNQLIYGIAHIMHNSTIKVNR